jgi:phage tail sheath protein FI
MAVKDNAEGYWVSPSNTQILGITGPKLLLTAGISDTGSNVNLLNEQGIVTVFSAYGTGYRLWGNRSSAFPVETTSDNFIAVQRVKDVLNASVEQAMLPFIDRPINQALIDSIRETVNAFIRTLVGRGALIDGECTYNPDDNPSSEIAAGRLVFDIAFAAPTPAERITFKSYLDQSLLGALA